MSRAATALSLLILCSCMDNFIFEGEGDCGTYYHIRFKYDYNMKFADAFANEVNCIALFVFDSEGRLIERVESSDKESLSSGAFEIRLELQEGRYDLVAWGGLMNEESFDLLADIEIGNTTKEELMVRMNRENAAVTKDLSPLYHGTLPLEVTSHPGNITETITLMKNTNVIRVVLQELSGNSVDADKFRFDITDDNGALYAWDNDFLVDETLTYLPWSMSTGTAEIQPKTTTSVSVALAEFTIGRMKAGNSPVLNVTNKETGKRVLSIPVADYALLIKGQYNKSMSDQEYLDRQDEYNMTFFLDNNEWVNSSIIINSWKVVINNTEID